MPTIIDLDGVADPLLFFFYGTLIAGSGNATARAIHGRLHFIGQAAVPGTLWAIPDAAGWYPALIPAPDARVTGVLYAAEGFGSQDLARMDEWEDYRPDHPAESLYLREEMRVSDAGRPGVTAQVYCYNQPLPAAACAIPQGDFQAWLIATGHAAYSG